MGIKEAVELFSSEMKNEIYNNVSDEPLQDVLIQAVEDAEATVISTYKASMK